MPNTVTAGVLLDLQNLYRDMYSPDSDSPHKQPVRTTFDTAIPLFERNRARVSPVLINGEERSVQLNYQVYADDETPDINGDSSDVGTSCAVSAGDFPTTAKQDYDNNIIIRETVSVDDNLTNNIWKNGVNMGHHKDVDAAILVANQIEVAIARIRAGINARMITYLNASRTPVSIDGNLPDNVVFDGTADAFMVADTTLFQNVDFLTDVDAIAKNERLGGEYFFINGRRAWYNSVINSDYYRRNDNGRNQVRFDDFDMYFDIAKLDATLGDINSFVVSPGAYAVWNSFYSGAAPEEISLDTDANRRFVYYIEDPALMIWENGSLRNVRYEVVYVNGCGGRRQISQRFWNNHTFEITFHGGFQAAPASATTHTGILKFLGTAGV